MTTRSWRSCAVQAACSRRTRRDCCGRSSLARNCAPGWHAGSPGNRSGGPGMGRVRGPTRPGGGRRLRAAPTHGLLLTIALESVATYPKTGRWWWRACCGAAAIAADRRCSGADPELYASDLDARAVACEGGIWVPQQRCCRAISLMVYRTRCGGGIDVLIANAPMSPPPGREPASGSAPVRAAPDPRRRTGRY